MPIEPVFEKINITCPCDKVKEQIKIESRSDVSASEVERVLSASAFAVITDKQVINGQIRYGGKVTFYLSYVDSEGRVRRTECGSEFSGTMENSSYRDGARVKLSACVEKVETLTDGIKLACVAYLSVSATCYEKNEIMALSGGENLIANNKSVPVIKSFGLRESTFTVEEEFELSYPVQEVLSHRADAVITAVQCGVGTIIVDGEVCISIIALQKTEKGGIIKENKLMPFRFELDCEDAMPSCQATAKVKEKSFKIDISVDEENNSSTLTSQVVLQFEGEAFMKSETLIAIDAFSTSEEVEVVYDEFTYFKDCQQYTETVQVSGRCLTDELPQGATVLAVGGEKAEAVSFVKSEGGIEIVGSISATAYFSDDEARIFTRKIETPFEKVIQALGEDFDGFELDCSCKKACAKMVSLTEIALESEIVFSVYPCKTNKIKFVKEAKSVGEKKPCLSAISVYIPMEGEDLWSLSKRLNVCPDTLVATNRELQFPLTGKERIVIYKQN